MKTIGISTARGWQYRTPDLMSTSVQLGRIYFFKGGSAYFHHPQKPVILGYRHKDFIYIQNEQKMEVLIYPRSLSNQRIIAWFQSWCSKEAILINSGGTRTVLKKQETIDDTEFIYFILNIDSQGVKIGRSKNVEKRKNSLQTANPVELILLKAIKVDSEKEAKNKESELHQKFAHLNILGEWFKFDIELQEFIQKL